MSTATPTFDVEIQRLPVKDIPPLAHIFEIGTPAGPAVAYCGRTVVADGGLVLRSEAERQRFCKDCLRAWDAR